MKLGFSIRNITVCMFLAFWSTPAFAQLTITAGLDSGTKDLINQLPDKIREALVKALAQALPMIDKSVAGYLDQVNKIIASNIASGTTAVQCAAMGSAKIVQTELETSLANILYTGRRKGLNDPTIGNYTQSLSDAISDTRSHITVNTTANEVLVAYSDLLIRAAIIRCAGNMNPALLQNELDAQIKRISIPDLEWHVLIGNRDRPYCQKIYDCVVKRRDDLQKYLKTADQRDVDSSQANALMKTIAATPTPPRPGVVFDRTPSIQILDYEQILLSLRDVERAVEAAKASRQAKAQSTWSEATKARDVALLNVKNNQDNIDHPTDRYQDNTNVVNRYPELVRLSNVAIGLAKSAAQIDASYKQQSDELIQKMNENIKRADQLLATAKKNLQQLIVEQVKAMQIDRFNSIR